jgi:hypothetical protein
MLRLRSALVAILVAAAGVEAGPAAPVALADSCQFVLGFQALHDQIPAIVGSCVTNEEHAENGDGLQRTGNGLLVWRRADNYTAFTDGYRTWVSGPFGLQERPNSERFDWEKSASVASTQVIAFQPPQTASRSVTGDCFSSSLAATRPDAWRCISGNEILDPCFSLPGSSSAVVCVRDPRDSNSFATLNLTRPLPAAAPPGRETHPWFLQLADGTVCNFFTGATGGIGGERLNYGCSDRWDIVGMTQAGTPWTAREVLLAPRSLNVLDSATVKVAIVWE